MKDIYYEKYRSHAGRPADVWLGKMQNTAFSRQCPVAAWRKAVSTAFRRRDSPTLKQAQNSGARYLDTVIGFKTSATFSEDRSIGDRSLWNIAMRSDRPGPISISDVTETGFKESKRWWQFWKK